MNLGIRAPKDFWIGVVYATAGAAGFLISRDYPMGSGARMGPGYFPTVVSSLLILFGIVSMVRSLIINGEAIGRVSIGALLLVIGSQVAFALLVDGAGFIFAALTLLLVGAAASRNSRLEPVTVIAAVALVAVCAFVFINRLGVPMPLIGPWLAPMLPTWFGG